MRMQEVKEILDAAVICGEDWLTLEIKVGCGSDLMSHVLASITSDDVLLLTGLVSHQVIYVSDAVNIRAICFVNGKRPEQEIIELAQERKMVLLSADCPTFDACGKLYQHGLAGCVNDECDD